ncbi:MAG: DegT/DnrJ/EryC1/StrS family aminotransferase [Proteobacteria bacterium]|nr:DegT/DnrJ/EryC1/StrS family aminotransferase [Pseudomonadota bacterium]
MSRAAEKILFANPVAQFKSQRKEILAAIESICDNGPYILGSAVEDFENAFAAWHGLANCVGVGSGTDALTLALRAFGIGAGDEVITVSFTALATASAILATGAKPVLVDVTPSAFTMDAQKVEAAVTSRTRAIIPVHLYGYPCDMDAAMAIARKHGLIVIEDCAQAHGALYKGKKAGTIGNAGCFSFYPTKNLGAIGDAGAVITSDAAIAEKIKEFRQYGWNKDRIAHNVSTVSRMDPLQAVILSVKLKALDASTSARRTLAQTYDDAINWQKFGKPAAQPDAISAYHLYVITAKDRSRVIGKLAAANIAAGIHYEFPVHKNPGYAPCVAMPANGMPVTDRLSEAVLSLPMYPEFPKADAVGIAKIINEA